MNKRYIGLDIGARRTLLVVLEYDKDELVGVHYQESHQETLEEQLRELREEFSPLHAGDRLATVISARRAFVRNLEFPFKGGRKIAAALPLALNAQIPVSTEDCAMSSYLIDTPEDGSALVKAAAVPREALTAILDICAQVEVPLHVVDLSPFGYVAGLAQELSEAVLILSGEDETTVSLVKEGGLIDYRLIPGGANLLNEDKAVVIEREIRALLKNAGEKTLPPVYLCGEAAHDELMRLLTEQELEVQELGLSLAGEEIPSAFAPAAAIALRAAALGKEGSSFNFRSGEFALSGEWQKYRSPLIFTCGLILVAIVMLALTGVTSYQAKSSQVDVLEKEIESIYRQTFPGSRVIVDVPLQMQTALRDLEEQSALVGGAQMRVLQVLKGISDLPQGLSVELQEFSYNPTETRISGSADSFEQVNLLTETLAGSPLFAEVRVADAKMSVKGDKVNFRLLVIYAGNGRGQ